MPDAFPSHDQVPALLALIEHLPAAALRGAACSGAETDDYHPEVGQPAEVVLSLCRRCPSRLACLALALRTEDPQVRYGWYGGLGPHEREHLAVRLGLAPAEAAVLTGKDVAHEAARLRAQGKTVNQIAQALGCSRRTAQRYLRAAA